ncbi:hypothetical protein N656DRAFT_444355 [Canariomyces notabilis]|uniref:Uncharacterized protein n=1 Tax=Canariomyces notabilis TaxID=2074819 RepID=A0AAN6QDF6_9PEZI|nr:hypothetical protein N656DRAFT_444355 [Canariomyces arenarius]
MLMSWEQMGRALSWVSFCEAGRGPRLSSTDQISIIWDQFTKFESRHLFPSRNRIWNFNFSKSMDIPMLLC